MWSSLCSALMTFYKGRIFIVTRGLGFCGIIRWNRPIYSPCMTSNCKGGGGAESLFWHGSLWNKIYVEYDTKQRYCVYFQIQFIEEKYGGILLSLTCMMNFVNTQDNYLNMRLIYVNMRENYVNMRFKLCCMSIHNYLTCLHYMSCM